MAKKKSNPHSEDNNKPTKTHHQIPDDSVSEKLETLKSLNAMLLKETVDRRQQVESLTQINGSLEAELNRCNSDKVSLESQVSGLTERAVMLEIEKGLVCRFVTVQVSEMAEFSRRERVAMEERIGGLERDVKRVLEEKSAIERVKNEKESEIGSLNCRLNTLVAELGEEKFVGAEVCRERDEIRARLDERIACENGLRLKLAEAEKREAVVLEKSEMIKVVYGRLMQEKIATESKVDLIMREKDAVERSLAELNGLVIDLKRDIEKIVKEKKVIEEDRNVEQRKKNELNELVHKLRKGEEQLVKKVSDLEKKCVMGLEKEAEMSMKIDVLVIENQEIQESVQKLTQEKSLITKDLNDAKNELKNTIDKLHQLESEIGGYKAALDYTQTNLNKEKLTMKNLSEKLSKGFEETHKLDAEKNAIAENIQKLKNSLAKTQKEHDDTKAKLRRSEANTTQILKILQATSTICNSEDNNDMGIAQEPEFGDDIKHVTEIEAIKKAFKMLKLCVAKADKGKSFWTMVSSATTVVAAAVSLAYVARGGC